jgi:hypothetical protein
VRTSDGRSAGFPLRDRLACADFYADLFAALQDLGVHVEIVARPYDLGDSPPFAQDTTHDRYDAAAVERFFAILRLTDVALARFASRFNGKASPIQLFWHSFDLAHARYSGGRAPAMECADPVGAEAYSHEVIAFGWWPGDERRTPYPAFYSYTAPEPDGLRDQPLSAGEWIEFGSGSLAILPYDTVRTAPDPRRAVLAFCQSAYEAGARLAGWNTGGFESTWCPSPGQLQELHAAAAAAFGRTMANDRLE